MYDQLNPAGTLSRPGEPTSASPGSERKIRILTERATRREPLFHPLDSLVGKFQSTLPLLADELPERSESA